MITRAIAFQHMDNEPPGLFGEFLAARGAKLDIIQLHRGEEIPSLAPYDFMLVMGGAMDVWEEAQNPWLISEKAAIREWAINRNRPFFGVCLCMQLLDEALAVIENSDRRQGGDGLNSQGSTVPLARNSSRLKC